MKRKSLPRGRSAWLPGLARLAGLAVLSVLLLQVLHWGPVVVAGSVLLVGFLGFAEWHSREVPLTRRLEDGHSSVPLPLNLTGPTWSRETSDAPADRSTTDHP
jgi:hypothetical protein